MLREKIAQMLEKISPMLLAIVLVCGGLTAVPVLAADVNIGIMAKKQVWRDRPENLKGGPSDREAGRHHSVASTRPSARVRRGVAAPNQNLRLVQEQLRH